MYKEFNKTNRNKVKVGFIKNDTVDLKKYITNVSKDDADKIETLNK